MLPHGISYNEALRVWLRVALQSFGGPAGQIAVMHRILVEEKRWVGEERFLHALNYCMLLPGPEAQQLATYVGWLLHGCRGGLTAGILFVLPGFLSILALSFLYTAFSDVAAVSALLFGVKAAVFAVVLSAVRRIGGRVLKNGAMVVLAALAFVAIFCFQVPFPAIILAAGSIGWSKPRSSADSTSTTSKRNPSGVLRITVHFSIRPHPSWYRGTPRRAPRTRRSCGRASP